MVHLEEELLGASLLPGVSAHHSCEAIWDLTTKTQVCSPAGAFPCGGNLNTHGSAVGRTHTQLEEH